MTHEESLSVLNFTCYPSKEQVKRRYRELAKSCHPDLFPAHVQPRADARFKTLRSAIETVARGAPQTPTSKSHTNVYGNAASFDPAEVWGNDYSRAIEHNAFAEFVDRHILRNAWSVCLIVAYVWTVALVGMLFVGVAATIIDAVGSAGWLVIAAASVLLARPFSRAIVRAISSVLTARQAGVRDRR